ncbi:Arc family DNA-binding protein [Isoalcanivorax indicus]|uniref:Arc family DNA-binding protein n=1 Tax=Isoalcanivorax indicus TaxID=2202653 RepID=UPI000DBAB9C6|nr:Arc family DNA-binding protein [Isoalcanivorax indicus]
MDKKAAAENRQEVEKFVVRLPKGIRGRICELAKYNKRSMNAEIVARLEESLGLTVNVEGVAESAPHLYAVSAEAPQSGGGDPVIITQEDQLLERFRAMSMTHRRALLELLR